MTRRAALLLLRNSVLAALIAGLAWFVIYGLAGEVSRPAELILGLGIGLVVGRYGLT